MEIVSKFSKIILLVLVPWKQTLKLGFTWTWFVLDMTPGTLVGSGK